MLDGALSLRSVLSLLDILSVAAIFYWTLGVVRGTRAVPVLKGLVVLLTVSVGLGALFQLTPFQLPALNFLLQRAVLPGFIVAIPVIFQPELRRALERIGTSTSIPQVLPAHGPERGSSLAHSLAAAAVNLAERGVGALMVIERDTGLQDVVDTGNPLDAAVSPSLLETIFTPDSPLHDGAVIISRGRLVAAGCVLPLSDNLRVIGERGTRHRAAVGITETSDAIAIVVSEETGTVSVSQSGRLLSNFTADRLERLLSIALRDR